MTAAQRAPIDASAQMYTCIRFYSLAVLP